MSNLKKEYLEKVKNVKDLKIVIIGQDPYLFGANGIAFCKNTFDELYNENCSGGTVLKSLAYSKEVASGLFDTPVEMFMALLYKGIAFLNMSGEILDSKEVEYYEKFHEYNSEFLSKSQNIVVLGVGQAKTIFDALYLNDFNVKEYLIHPSRKNQNDPRWKKVWQGTYLKDRYLDGAFDEKAITYPKLNKEELANYFNMNLANTQLYSKGRVETGMHGLEFKDGDYFASHFHLKTKLAKPNMRSVIENISPQELTQRASDESSFKHWPKVKYSSDYYDIQKYSLSWLVKQFR